MGIGMALITALTLALIDDIDLDFDIGIGTIIGFRSETDIHNMSSLYLSFHC